MSVMSISTLVGMTCSTVLAPKIKEKIGIKNGKLMRKFSFRAEFFYRIKSLTLIINFHLWRKTR